MELWIGVAGVLAGALILGLQVGFSLVLFMELLANYFVYGIKGFSIVIFIPIVLICWGIIMLVIGLTLWDGLIKEGVKESLKTGQSSEKAEGVFWLLVAAHAFLVWFWFF